MKGLKSKTYKEKLRSFGTFRLGKAARDLIVVYNFHNGQYCCPLSGDSDKMQGTGMKLLAGL